MKFRNQAELLTATDGVKSYIQFIDAVCKCIENSYADLASEMLDNIAFISEKLVPSEIWDAISNEKVVKAIWDAACEIVEAKNDGNTDDETQRLQNEVLLNYLSKAVAKLNSKIQEAVVLIETIKAETIMVSSEESQTFLAEMRNCFRHLIHSIQCALSGQTIVLSAISLLEKERKLRGIARQLEMKPAEEDEWIARLLADEKNLEEEDKNERPVSPVAKSITLGLGTAKVLNAREHSVATAPLTERRGAEDVRDLKSAAV